MKNKRQSITWTKPQLAFLKREAERLGVSFSEVARRIVERYREDKAVTKWTSGRDD